MLFFLVVAVVSSLFSFDLDFFVSLSLEMLLLVLLLLVVEVSLTGLKQELQTSAVAEFDLLFESCGGAGDVMAMLLLVRFELSCKRARSVRAGGVSVKSFSESIPLLLGLWDVFELAPTEEPDVLLDL
jgi:hypothetical protein